MSEEEYYNRLELKYLDDMSKVSVEDYQEVSEKLKELDQKFDIFKETIFNLAKENDAAGIMEFLKSEGVF